jgi:hypothetical protein
MAKRSVEEDGGEAFAGPSKPRVIYERPGERELPMISVSYDISQKFGARS